MMEVMCVVLGNIIVKSVYTICVTVAAIYFAKPAILWWYVLLLLIGFGWEKGDNEEETGVAKVRKND